MLKLNFRSGDDLLLLPLKCYWINQNNQIMI